MEAVCVVLSPSDVRKINDHIRRIEQSARRLRDVAPQIDEAAVTGGLVGSNAFDRSTLILNEADQLGHRFRSAVFQNQKKQREGEQGEIGSGSRR